LETEFLIRKNLLTLSVGSFVGIVLLSVWLYFNPLQDIIAHFATVNYYWVALASVVYLSAYFLRACRWRLLIPSPAHPGLFRTWLYAMGGNWVNYLIPIRVGDVVRAWFLKRFHQIPMMRALPSVFIDKAFDTIAIAFIIIIIPFSAIKLSSAVMVLLSLLLLVFVLTLLLLLSAAWQKDIVIRVLQFLFSWCPRKFRSKVNSGVDVFVSELNLFEHHPLQLVFALILTAMGIMLDGLYFFLLFKAFSVPYSFPLALLGYTLINLSYALPQPPAQLGSNEWMMIIVFSVGFGLTKSTASAIMAFAHILTAGLMTFWGGLAFITLGPEALTKLFKGEKLE